MVPAVEVVVRVVWKSGGIPTYQPGSAVLLSVAGLGELVGLDSCLLRVFFCSGVFGLPVQFLPACCPRVLTAVCTLTVTALGAARGTCGHVSGGAQCG